MSDPYAPTVLARFPHEFQAELVVNELQRQGIQAKSIGATISGFRAEVPADVTVIVPAKEFDRAHQLIRQIEDLGDEVDWSVVPVVDESNTQETEFDTAGWMKIGLLCLALVVIAVIIAFAIAGLIFG